MLVVIGSMLMVICNRFDERLANNGEITTVKVPSFRFRLGPLYPHPLASLQYKLTPYTPAIKYSLSLFLLSGPHFYVFKISLKFLMSYFFKFSMSSIKISSVPSPVYLLSSTDPPPLSSLSVVWHAIPHPLSLISCGL